MADNIIRNVTAFPNPTNGKFEVKCLLAESAVVEYFLFEVLSNKTVFQGKSEFRDEHMLEFNLETYPSGLYALVLSARDEVRVIRILKQ